MDLNEARKKGEIKVIALLYVPSIGRTIENVRRSKFGEQDFLIREEAEGLKLDGDFVEDYQKKGGKLSVSLPAYQTGSRLR